MQDLAGRYRYWKHHLFLWWNSDIAPLLAGLRAIPSPRRLTVIFGAVYLFLSLFVMVHYLHASLLGDRYYRDRFETMYNGTAWKPFVYRVLVPQVTHGLVDLTPHAWQRSINDSIDDLKENASLSAVKAFLPDLNRLFPDRKQNYPRFVAILLIYGCLWGYIVSMFKLAAQLFPGNTALHYFAPIFSMLGIISFSYPFQYLYDIPVLFLSAACYYCMAAGRWRAYLIFFVLACLNKESSIFIFMFFTIWFFNRLPTNRYAVLWSTQCAIYLVIKATVTIIYIHNAGFFLEGNLGRVLQEDVFSTSKFNRMFIFAALFFLLTYRWGEKPAFLKAIFWVCPFMYIAYMYHGMPGEYRVFFDIMPPLLLLGAHTLVETAGLSRVPLFATAKEPPHAPMA